MVNQEYIYRCINEFETLWTYDEIIMPSKMGDWSRYQYHEFSQADGGEETVEWADYVTRLWQKDKTPIDRTDHEVALLVGESNNITDSAINRELTDTPSLKRDRDQDGTSLSTNVGAIRKKLTDLEIAKLEFIQKGMEKQNLEKQKRAREQESQLGEASERPNKKPS
jgi:hypothetical protein